MTDPDPRPARAAATDPAEPVTAADIAAFTARFARLRPPTLGGDPTTYAAEYAALLAHKAELFGRIADQHAGTDSARAHEAREIAEHAHLAARHAADAHDTTNVNDLARVSGRSRSWCSAVWDVCPLSWGNTPRGCLTIPPDPYYLNSWRR